MEKEPKITGTLATIREMDNPPAPDINLGIPDIDGGQLAADAEAEMPRLQAEDAAWQEKYNTPRAQETPETEQTETQEMDEANPESQENLTTRLRPGL